MREKHDNQFEIIYLKIPSRKTKDFLGKTPRVIHNFCPICPPKVPAKLGPGERSRKQKEKRTGYLATILLDIDSS